MIRYGARVRHSAIRLAVRGVHLQYDGRADAVTGSTRAPATRVSATRLSVTLAAVIRLSATRLPPVSGVRYCRSSLVVFAPDFCPGRNSFTVRIA
ncbi:hypothetical protein BX592_10934 [Paraburkholderia rhizosphaerae]|uniref:Uncharacterized protein n=1 Tax=Paraburkholderia rhizosphaerae TaxID=480658 RepID=A0A4V3HEU0_9BURK|nr:hypothetical protein BX592_10934 [Paraburkholderia rhizosphaerae]